jgi:aminopeptidase-like protein
VYDAVRTMQNFIAYADGKNDLIGISNILNTPIDELIPIKDKLMEHQLLAIK